MRSVRGSLGYISPKGIVKERKRVISKKYGDGVTVSCSFLNEKEGYI